jgi:hypothetical protein
MFGTPDEEIEANTERPVCTPHCIALDGLLTRKELLNLSSDTKEALVLEARSLSPGLKPAF